MNELQNVENILQLYKFRNQLGEEIVWSEGQKEIMAPIINLGFQGKHYVQIESLTQYGKSSAVAAAIVMRCSKKEAWAIVAGTAEKAQIIMDYIIEYALDNPIPRELLKGFNDIDKLKQERSRRSLTFSSGFEVRVFSADSRNKQNTGNAIMGFGAPFVVLDEAALVDDVIESKVHRMISGFSTTKHLYLKIGNPFYRNHFLKSHNDPDYHLVTIDYHRALKEGRVTQEMVEKARGKPGFNVLYEVKFPEAGAVDEKGWSPLLTDEDIEAVQVTDGFGFGFMRIGFDPSGEGNNFNVAVKRYRNFADILFKQQHLDQWQATEKFVGLQTEWRASEQIMPDGYYVDRIGIGEGHYQTMRMSLEGVRGINVGVAPYDTDNFVNLRAEAYWKLREAIKSKRLHLKKSQEWNQLTNIKYRTRLEGRRGKIEIMSKEEMLRNGVQSPDVADALMLTFTEPEPLDMIYAAPREEISNERFTSPFSDLI